MSNVKVASEKYDRIYYWSGGVERGSWKEGIPNCYPEYTDVFELAERTRRMGSITVLGNSKIGAPECNPHKCELTH
jgi:hypothetical protein